MKNKYSYKLYEEEDTNYIVTTLGVVVPKDASNKLKNITGRLATSLEGISATFEQLADSA
jgi:hypothetical protein